MRKFVEYFTVVGVSEENYAKLKLGDIITPVVLQIIPDENAKDFPFPSGLSEFCLPDGWKVYGSHRKPMFYSTVLTGIDGSKSYIASLACFENTSLYRNSHQNEEEIELYVPKALCFVSRMAYFDNFRECLSVILASICGNLTVTSSSADPLSELILAKILYGCGPCESGNTSVTITLDDRNTCIIHPPLSETIPKTDDCVAVLFKLVGIYNLTKLFTALLLDNKVVFISKAYSHLYKSTKGLISLLYPLKYSYVFIPILPTKLIEILSAPTPFLVGLHSSCHIDYSDLTDVLIMNLDTGQLSMHESFVIPSIPAPYYQELLDHLVDLARPELYVVDEVYADCSFHNSKLQDKKIRACFFLLMVKLLAGYRPCITYVRLFPTPVMKFHAELFIERREIKDADFFMKFFNTTSFNEFIDERGPTYREFDYFDEVMNIVGYSWSSKSAQDQMAAIAKCTESFYTNEPSCDPRNSVSRISIVDSWVKCDFSSIKLRPINVLRVKHFAKNITAELPKYLSNNKRKKGKIPLNVSSFQHGMIFYVGYRRLELIQECISLIFGNKIPDARKVLPSVIQTLSSKSCQIALLNELNKFKATDKNLNVHQYSLISRLLNTILTNSKNRTCYSPVGMIISYGGHFCTLIKDKIVQYMYTSLQNHSIFKDSTLWENLFCYEAQRSLINLYTQKYTPAEIESFFYETETLLINNNSRGQAGVILHSDLRDTLGALNVTYNELSAWENMPPSKQDEISKTEVSFLYSQIIDLLCRMSYMIVDFDSVNIIVKEMDKNSNDTAHSKDENKFKTEKISEFTTLMNKIVANINHMISLKSEMITSLRELIYQLVTSQFDLMVTICRTSHKSEDKELTSEYKPRLLNGEVMLTNIASYLFVDRCPVMGYDRCGSFSLLPAEGFLFVTNKQIIFKGYSIDSFLSDFCVYITVPLNLILKYKHFNYENLKLNEEIDFNYFLFIKLKNNLSFQIAFPKSTHLDVVEQIRRHIKTGISYITTLNIKRGRFVSLNRFKNENIPENKYGILAGAKNLKKAAIVQSNLNISDDPSINISEGSMHKDRSTTLISNVYKPSRKPTIKRKLNMVNPFATVKSSKDTVLESHTELSLSSYDNILITEFTRMGFINDYKNESINRKVLSFWRVSQINKTNLISIEIPRFNIVPKFMSDETLLRNLKNYRHKRMPFTTWLYPIKNNSGTENGSILIRSEAPLRNVGYLTGSKLIQTSKNIYDVSSNILAIGSSIAIIRSKTDRDKCEIRRIVEQEGFSSLYTQNTVVYDIESWIPSSFYVFYDKNFSKAHYKEIDISCIHYEPPSPMTIKKSYLSFQKAFLPETSLKEGKKLEFNQQIHESKWFDLVSNYLSFALSLSFISDICYSSSLISLSDGVEIVSIVVSLVQILLDPYYRTFKGFQNLIEKDWLEYNFNFFGHNSTAFSPIIIFFLDCVYQLLKQFPEAFEFNTYYLSFIAFHNFSTKFDTFMIGETILEQNPDDARDFADLRLQDQNQGDLETSSGKSDRTSVGADDTTSYAGFNLNDMSQSQESIFKYIQAFNEICTVFNNMAYDPSYKSVLYPCVFQSCMEIWPFYYACNFQEESLFNLETLSEGVLNIGDLNTLNTLKSISHQVIDPDQLIISTYSGKHTYSYIGDGTPFVLDKISWLLFDINTAHDELDQHSQPLNDLLYNSIKSSYTPFKITSPERQAEFYNIRSISFFICDLTHLLKSESNEKSLLNAHVFNRDYINSIHTCQICAKIITNSGAAILCAKCGVAVHSNCRSLLLTTCIPQSQLADENGKGTETDKILQNYANFSEDDFFVRGKVCIYDKNRKTQSFSVIVLDKSNHTINSYSSMELIKKTLAITSSDILECKSESSPPLYILKQFDKCGYFEIISKRKRYKLITHNADEAVKWVKAINSFIISKSNIGIVV